MFAGNKKYSWVLSYFNQMCFGIICIVKGSNLIGTKEMLKFEVLISAFLKEEKCRRLLKNS